MRDLFRVVFRLFGVEKVALVADGNDGDAQIRTFRNVREDFLVFFVESAREIENSEDQLGLLERFDASLYADAFYEIVCSVYACGVGETESNVSCGYCFGNDVTGCSRDAGNDGAFLFGEQIQDGGFSGVGLAENDGADTFTDGVSRFIRITEIFER